MWNCDTLKFFRGSRPLQHRPQSRAALEISALTFHSTSPFPLHHHHPVRIGGCVAVRDQKMAVATYAYPVHVARLIAWCREALRSASAAFGRDAFHHRRATRQKPYRTGRYPFAIRCATNRASAGESACGIRSAAAMRRTRLPSPFTAEVVMRVEPAPRAHDAKDASPRPPGPPGANLA